MPHIKPDALRQIGYQLFETAGCPPESARAVVDHLVESSLYGHDSHGSLRIYEYIGQIQDGIFDPKGQPSIISDRPCALFSRIAFRATVTSCPSSPRNTTDRLSCLTRNPLASRPSFVVDKKFSYPSRISALGLMMFSSI